jgi:DNA-binding CsgD family transcriptional regulator
VRTHVYRLLRKLDARDRAHAVAIGYRTFLLSLPEPEEHDAR